MLLDKPCANPLINTIAEYFPGVLQLIGYRSLSADNRLGMFDRRSLEKADLKKK